MNYISRHAESAVEKLTKMFGAVLVAGPRQVGKTTMLRRITKDINYVSLDDLIVQASAREQSGTFSSDKDAHRHAYRSKLICLYENLISLTDTDRVIPLSFL